MANKPPALRGPDRWRDIFKRYQDLKLRQPEISLATSAAYLGLPLKSLWTVINVYAKRDFVSDRKHCAVRQDSEIHLEYVRLLATGHVPDLAPCAIWLRVSRKRLGRIIRNAALKSLDPRKS